MWDLIKCFVKFVFRPTSERASILCIVLASRMTWKDCRDIGDYFKEVAKIRGPAP